MENLGPIGGCEDIQQKLRQSDEKLRLLTESLNSGLFRSTLDGRFLHVNRAVVRMAGYDSAEELLSKPATILYADPADRERFIALLLRDGEVNNMEMRSVKKNGEMYWISISAVIQRDRDGRPETVMGAFIDITDRKESESILQSRLDLIAFADHHSLPELLQKTLDEACAITGSSIGFHQFLNPDQKTISLQAWSTRTVNEFCKAEGKGLHYGVENAGVWGDGIRQGKPVIHNDYASLPHRKGLPEGHAPVVRELVTPVFREGRIVAILGVGNKLSDYNEKDVRLVSYFADVAWEIASRKMAEDALKASEKRYHAIYDQSPIAIELYDADGALVHVNDACLRLFGIENIQGINRFNLFDDPNLEERHKIDLRRGKAVHYQAPFDFEKVREQNLYPTQKKGILWLDVHISPLFDDAGSIFEFLVQAMDITEQQQVQNLLRSQVRLSRYAHDHTIAETLREFVDEAERLTGSRIGFLHFVEKDQKALKLRAWSSETVNSMCKAGGVDSHYDLVKAGVWVDCVRQQAPVVHNDYPRLPHRKGLPPGHVPITRILTVPVFNGKRIAAVLGVGNKPTDYDPKDTAIVCQVADMAWDIIERKLAEETLNKSRAQLAEAQKLARIGSWELDVTNNRLVWSDETFHIFGLTPRQFGATLEAFLETVHPEDRETVNKAYQTSLSDESAGYDIEHRIIRKDTGEIRYVHEKCVHYRDDSGRIVRSIGTVQDITDKKQAEADRLKLMEQNQTIQKSESLDRMAGAVAHHFNNQLGVVMMSLEMALDELPPRSTCIDCIQTALIGARKAADISGMLLTSLGGNAIDRRENLDMAAVCKSLVSMIQATLPKHVILKTRLPDAGATVNADFDQIRRALSNLLVNAEEAIGEKSGVIGLSLNTVPASAISPVNRFPVNVQIQFPTYVCVEVSDNGGGIELQDMDNLFDPFFSRKFTGRGLGLSTALGIIRTYGGVITVESRPGLGSVFRVYLPVVPEEAHALRMETPDIPAPAPAPGETPRKNAILVVEDEEEVRRLIGPLLGSLGYGMLEAVDGMEAVSVFQQRRDEILMVLCDLTMPRMDGWETIAALRRLAPDIPVILTSGYHEKQVMRGNYAEMPQAFLHKPFNRAELMAAIRKGKGEFTVQGSPLTP